MTLASDASVDCCIDGDRSTSCELYGAAGAWSEADSGASDVDG